VTPFEQADREVVLVFVRAPKIGAVKTRLAVTVGDPAALAVYRWLAERTLTHWGLTRARGRCAPWSRATSTRSAGGARWSTRSVRSARGTSVLE
jgi:glycosyltransferase A (GT-A) superfamily protein (DUF2064 family)